MFDSKVAEYSSKNCTQGKIKMSIRLFNNLLFSFLQRQNVFLLVYCPLLYVGQWVQSLNKKQAGAQLGQAQVKLDDIVVVVVKVMVEVSLTAS